MDPGPRSKTGQAEWHGSPRRFMQSQRNIEEHRIKLKKYQTRQRQNRTKNRTRTGGTETKKQNRDRLTETEDLATKSGERVY